MKCFTLTIITFLFITFSYGQEKEINLQELKKELEGGNDEILDFKSHLISLLLLGYPTD